MEIFYVITFTTEINLKTICSLTQNLKQQVAQDTTLVKYMRTMDKFISN
jgi:hypothetical protein